jgi:hypothetical protein
MDMLKSAFDDGDSSVITSPEQCDDLGPFQFPKTKVKKEEAAIVEEDGVHCVICGLRLGRRLNAGAVMHLGLEDGDPICPKALHLTDESKEKLRNIALTKNIDTEKKFELFKMIELALMSGEDEDVEDSGCGSGGEDVLTRTENFLDSMERRRNKDREESAAIRAGLVGPVGPVGFVFPVGLVGPVGLVAINSEEEETYNDDEEDTISKSDSDGGQVLILSDETRLNVLEAIRNAHVLSPTNCDDRSECPVAGKVLRTDLGRDSPMFKNYS